MIFPSVFGLLLIGTIVKAFPKPQELPPQCADPTFACQDLESARLCGVVKSCANDIWATMSAPDDNDEICDICKKMVKEARDQLLSNMTQEEIKEVFEGSCKLLPIKLVADACIKVVDEIIPELVEMLASRMDPNMVCTVSGLCNMAHLPIENKLAKIFATLFSHRSKGDKCTECTVMMSDVQEFLNDTNESDVKEYVAEFCHKTVASYLCDVAVDTYLPHIYQYLKSTNPKTLCSSVGICPRYYQCDANINNEIKDELTCEFCEHVLEHVKEMIIANTTEEEFRTALLNFCKHLGEFSDKCTSLVNDYYDMLFDYIRKMDTKGLCTLMGLCDNSKCIKTPMVKVVPAMEIKKIPMIKLQPAKRISVNDVIFHPLIRVIPAQALSKKEERQSNEIFQTPLVPLQSANKFSGPIITFERDVECSFCKAISFFLKKDLNNDINEVNVQNAINQVCEKWVIEFPEECHKFLNKYSDKMRQAIGQKQEFEKICFSIDACTLNDEKPNLEIKVIPKVHDGPFCDLCKDAMNEVETQLKDPATKQRVENFLEQFCKLVPQSIQDDCRNFIDDNVETILELLEKELTPDNVCPALRLCSTEHRITVPQPIKDLECDVCKDVVKSFREKMQAPSAKTVVLTFLEEGCFRLPQSLATECREFVDKNIDIIMEMIIQELDPDSICAMLKICPATFIKEKESKLRDMECDLCKMVVQKLDDMLKDHRTEEEIKEALDKVCSYLPSSWEAKCENFVDEYTDLLINLLAQEADPEMICEALKLCPAKLEFAEWLSKAKDLECEGCQYALHFVQDQLMNPEIQGKLKELLKKMCDVLPHPYADNCIAFMDEYGSSFLVLIAHEIDPSVICWELKICTNQTMKFQPLSENILQPFKFDECSICTTVVDYLDKLLEEDDVDKEITHVIEKVCNVIPSSMKPKCVTILETYGPYLLQMIGQLADSRQVCQDIDLCSRPPGHVHLLGGHKCTFGPSYWCKSSAHAAACKAEAFCKQKIWIN